MATTTLTVPRLLHRPVDAGAMYYGPGDLYRFLVTGEETAGAYFATSSRRRSSAYDPSRIPTDNVDEIAARYAEAAPRYEMEFMS